MAGEMTSDESLTDVHIAYEVEIHNQRLYPQVLALLDPRNFAKVSSDAQEISKCFGLTPEQLPAICSLQLIGHALICLP